MQADVKEDESKRLSLPPSHADEDLTCGRNQAWIERLGQIYVPRASQAQASVS